MVYNHPPFAHLEPMQRIFTLNNPELRIEFPPGHCLEAHSSATKAQLVDILERCLQRDPRRRPSLPDLLAHPFLCSEAQVQREALTGAVASMMSRVTQAFGEAPEGEAAAPAREWQALGDEVWELASGQRQVP